jgi:nucleotide-binding universal stress UspA family protein
MTEKILVPLDGSRVGEAALPVVERVIAKFSPEVKVEVILMQVVPATHWIVAGDVGAPVSFTEDELEPIRRAALNYLSKAGETLKSRGIAVSTRIAIGNQADGILKAAEETGAGMIAMSTHGRSGFRRWAFGSVTDKVLRGAKVPVLTVRAAEGTKNESS